MVDENYGDTILIKCPHCSHIFIGVKNQDVYDCNYCDKEILACNIIIIEDYYESDFDKRQQQKEMEDKKWQQKTLI